MREGMDEMCRYEGRTEKSERVYSYEKAVERWDDITLPHQAGRTIIYATYLDFEATVCPKMESVRGKPLESVDLLLSVRLMLVNAFVAPPAQLS